MLLERGRDCGLAGCGEAGKPYREAFLLAEAIALSARERWVPGDIAKARVSEVKWCWRGMVGFTLPC